MSPKIKTFQYCNPGFWLCLVCICLWVFYVVHTLIWMLLVQLSTFSIKLVPLAILLQSLMKSLWSDETGWIINKVDKICCCVLLTSFLFKFKVVMSLWIQKMNVINHSQVYGFYSFVTRRYWKIKKRSITLAKGCQPWNLQILGIDREGIIDDVIITIVTFDLIGLFLTNHTTA